jgi:hypothetical protein
MCVRYTLHKSDAALAAIAAALARKPALSQSNGSKGLPDCATPWFNVTLTHVMPTATADEAGLFSEISKALNRYEMPPKAQEDATHNRAVRRLLGSPARQPPTPASDGLYFSNCPSALGA